MSTAVSRPVHPCVTSLSDAIRGAEFSCWAFLESHETHADSSLPNLVTACASCLTVYRVDPSGTLSIAFGGPFSKLATGSVNFLATLSSSSRRHFPDALLVGFAGNSTSSDSKLSVVTVHHDLLQAECLLDFGPLVQEASCGATDYADTVATVLQQPERPGHATVACILGGGVAVAVVELKQVKSTWLATKGQPFALPLSTVAAKLPHLQKLYQQQSMQQQQLLPLLGSSANTPSISTGFGDVFDAAFLSCYQEPVLILLHSGPQGRVWEGRLGRPEGEGGVSHNYFVTALSISVNHTRCALLWSQPVGADASAVKVFDESSKCLVVGANTLTIIDATGLVQQVIAVNGWARATCPGSLLSRLEPNPMLRLSLALDGSAWTWLDHSDSIESATPPIALVSLRRGQLYIFQRVGHKTWTLLPMGQTLGGIGRIDHLAALPLPLNGISNLAYKMGGAKATSMAMGLIFAGSRIGNSLLMGYSLETIQLPQDATSLSQQLTPFVSPSGSLSHMFESSHEGVGSSSEFMDAEYERILQLEEEALYSPIGAEHTDMTKELNAPKVEEQLSSRERKRQRLSAISVIRVLTPLDSLANPGPLGRSCEGPIAGAPAFIDQESSVGATEPAPIFGSPAHIFPSGFGSSGGINVFTAPGRDDRMILGEQDCLNVESMFSLPAHDLILLAVSEKMGGGVRVLRANHDDSGEISLDEIDVREWNQFCSESQMFESSADVFLSNLLMAGEFLDGSVCALLSTPSADGSPAYFIVTLEGSNGTLQLKSESVLESHGESLLQVTPFLTEELNGEQALTFVCVWNSGRAETLWVSKQGLFASHDLPDNSSPSNYDKDMSDQGEEEIRSFYNDNKIVCADVYKCPKSIFIRQIKSSSDVIQQRAPQIASASNLIPDFSSDDEDEADLYHDGDRSRRLLSSTTEDLTVNSETTDEQMLFIAVCRQSGKLDIYAYDDGGSLYICWTVMGCGQGFDVLQEGCCPTRLPRSHTVAAREIRFFFCRKSDTASERLCLSIERTDGDLELYSSGRPHENDSCIIFRKVRMTTLVRTSQEQSRHHTKLVRRRIVERSAEDGLFSYVRLHRFAGMSNFDGLFAACSQAAWIVPERGLPKAIVHRTRHGAPAGGKPRPVSAFCSGLRSGGFFTVHERVGRVGSQRLTTFRGLLPTIPSTGYLTGNNGYFSEIISLGVTVRAVSFVDDASVSSPNRPIYAMIVSRDLETDQHDIENDGLTPEERKKIEEEKQAAKIKKQVEADLGGFDLETEWVEEIEREDCFKIDEKLGGAPPISTQAYSLWIVDAANKWMVIDSYEFEEYEHALALQVMRLTDFPNEPGSCEEATEEPIDLKDYLFIAVGTGIVNHNGEDVASKGKTLLFELACPVVDSHVGDVMPELSLKYEKHIFHGPVTSLSCLTADGKHRLVIGAGSDVNVEQWGNDRLTQVGFFRATMHILDILHFKNFLLLSDAYDSLHFLVWRESDKSLTLLAKDYDPIPVYAAGLLSRGSSVTFMCNDDRQNLQFFQYSPGEAAARGGNKLICRADFHLGMQTTAIVSHFCRSSLHVHSATPSSTLAALKQQDTLFGKNDDDQKIGAFFGTTDGTVHSVVPISEPVYWRLMALQSVMANALESDCGLNHRAHRLYRRSSRRGGCRNHDRKKGVIDGDLVMLYVDLALVDQEDLASAIGSTVDLILDNLLEIQCNSAIM